MAFYGSVAGVAAYVRHMQFDASGNPTTSDVEGFLAQQSAVLNGWLAREGYTTPVTQADAVLVLARFANLGAAGLCELTQRSAGYTVDNDDAREAQFLKQFGQAEAYIKSGALAALGVAQARSPQPFYGLSVGGRTNSGGYLQPIFTRTSFGNQPTKETGEGEP